MSDISFSKLADLSSPILAQTCAMGKTIPRQSWSFSVQTATASG
jgi:type VI secretion system secreted protein Hcp